MALVDRPAELRGADLTADLAPMDVAARIPALRGALAGALVDALVVTNLTNIRYLTGFTGSAGMLVVSGNRALLVTDGRYAEQAPTQLRSTGAPVEVAVSGERQLELVRDELAAAGASAVGLEADAVTWGAQRRYETALAGFTLVATSGLVESLRLRKDLGELDRMVRAAAIADQALASVKPLLTGVLTSPGLTERAFAFELDMEIRRLGATGNSFETIVASGPNGALPHARPTDRVIERGDLVVLDFGAQVEGYCSDMTRTFAIGADGDLTDQRAAMVAAVAASQRAGVDAVESGVAATTVDAACRAVLAEANLADYFTHGTGHGVGLDIHEAPRVSKLSDATLAPGFVVTVEPGVYLAPHGGVRIEDTVVVTENGCWALTTSPKTLFVA